MPNCDFFPAFSQNNIPVVLATSNLYAPYAGVFIQSLIDHASKNYNYDIIVFEREVSDENNRLLKLIGQGQSNVSIRFYNVKDIFNQIDIVKFVTNNSYPVDTFCQMLAPLVLSKYDRLAAVNVDTLLKRNISDLFEIDLGENCLGGVRDLPWEEWCQNYPERRVFPALNISVQELCQNVLKLKNPYRVINGGLYLFNAEKYREVVTSERILKLLQGSASICTEDMLVSMLCEGEIEFIDPAWNLVIQPDSKHLSRRYPVSEEHRKIYELTFQNPYMLHWAGKPKPWVCPDVPYGSEWWETARRTPFMGHILSRMFDALQTRREYYKNKYGQDVAVWDPIPNVDRSKKET